MSPTSSLSTTRTLLHLGILGCHITFNAKSTQYCSGIITRYYRIMKVYRWEMRVVLEVVRSSLKCSFVCAMLMASVSGEVVPVVPSPGCL